MSATLAPVALFAYRRPGHVRRTLTALAANPEASGTDLIAFVDGARLPSDAAEVAATIAESEVFGDLQAPIRRLCGLDTPIPYSPTLEKASVPQVDDIVGEAAALVGEW